MKRLQDINVYLLTKLGNTCLGYFKEKKTRSIKKDYPQAAVCPATCVERRSKKDLLYSRRV